MYKKWQNLGQINRNNISESRPVVSQSNYDKADCSTSCHILRPIFVGFWFSTFVLWDVFRFNPKQTITHHGLLNLRQSLLINVRHAEIILMYERISQNTNPSCV